MDVDNLEKNGWGEPQRPFIVWKLGGETESGKLSLDKSVVFRSLFGRATEAFGGVWLNNETIKD